MTDASGVAAVGDSLGELPAGWSRATLDQLGVEAQPGFASGRHNRDGHGIVHLRPMNITRGGIVDLSDARYVGDESDRRVEFGDVLFNNTNSPALVGKTAWVDSAKPLAYSNHMTRLRPPECLHGKFLAVQLHWLWSCGYFKTVLNNHVNQASVASKVLLQTPVVVPPTAEQHRIVAELDKQLAHIYDGETALANAQTQLTEFEASLLARATKQHPDASIWGFSTIGEMAKVSSGATPLKGKSEYYDDGTIPWITSSLLNDAYVYKGEKYITELALKETAVKEYPPGTILLAMYGEGKTRGKCSELRIRATTNQACAAIQLHPEYESRRDWLKTLLEALYEENRALASGGVQPNLSLSLIKKIRVPLPPHAQQRKILAELTERRSDASAMAKVIAEAQAQAHALRGSLLATAFSGKLVPQDAADEPASVLLDRIRAERATTPARKRAARTRRTTRKTAPPGQEELPQ
ncbi:restriction endonuclease subunit S [Streptomyces sp. NPDC093097]|uniref:restriction endonuclease subunit S n=1 Tax=Streptomyces sp. NPDC093097 TaxID=3366027 RepID=UPI0037FA5CAE